MANKFTETKDPEIAAAEREIAGGTANLPVKQEAEMGVSKLLDTEMPDFFKKYARGQGMEQIPSEDKARPRLKLTQRQSPHLGEAGTRLGDWYLPTGKENLKQKLRFTPVFCDVYGLLRDPSDLRQVWARTKWLLDPVTGERSKMVWDPSETKFTAILPNSNNKQETWYTDTSVFKSKLLKWGSREKGNPKGMAGTKFIRVFAYLHDYPKLSPVEISFGMSSYPVGQTLMSQLGQVGGPVFGNKYVLGSREVDEGGGKKYLVYTVEADGLNTDEAFVDYLARMEEGLRKMKLDVIVDEDELDDGPEPTGNGGTLPNLDI